MQNCVNYCRNKRGSLTENKTHIAQMQMHKTHCVIPHFLSLGSINRSSDVANIDRFFRCHHNQHIVCERLNAFTRLKDKSQNGGEIYKFFNFLEIISNNVSSETDIVKTKTCKQHQQSFLFSLLLFDCLEAFMIGVNFCFENITRTNISQDISKVYFF